MMKKICATLLLALTLSLPVTSLPPASAWAQDREAAAGAAALTQAPKKMLAVQEVKSPGGITAWLVEDHTLPIIALQFSFKESGSARDPQERQGLARLASNTMDEGAGPYDSQAFQKALTDHSISLSFSAGRDDFGGGLKMLTRHKDKAIELLGLALTQPRFDQEAIDRMKAANIARIKSSMTEPDWISARLQNDLAYAGHAYGLNAGGTLSTLAAISRADLQNFVKNNLSRDRLHVGVAGDITPQELATILDQLFGALPATAQTSKLADIEIQNTGKTYLYKQDIPQSFINLVGPGLDYKDPDYYAGIVMNFILGGSGFGSRLTEEVREKRGLTYGIHSSLFDMDHVSGFSIGLSTENKNAGAALKIISDELEKMRTQGATAEELANAKSYLIGSLPLGLSSTAAIAGALLSLQVNDYPMDHYDRYPAIIGAITAADIARVSQRLLNPDKMLRVIVGEPAGIAPTQILTTIPNVE